jgi:hypothetical protein
LDDIRAACDIFEHGGVIKLKDLDHEAYVELKLKKEFVPRTNSVRASGQHSDKKALENIQPSVTCEAVLNNTYADDFEEFEENNNISKT